MAGTVVTAVYVVRIMRSRVFKKQVVVPWGVSMKRKSGVGPGDPYYTALSFLILISYLALALLLGMACWGLKVVWAKDWPQGRKIGTTAGVFLAGGFVMFTGGATIGWVMMWCQNKSKARATASGRRSG